MSSSVAPAAAREPGSLPFPERPVGAVNDSMPFDHLVVVMMENHSFDNLLGALPLTHEGADGLTFDDNGNATNSNPGGKSLPAAVASFPLEDTSQATHVSQSWRATHEQIDGGAMDGFVRAANNREPMGYYTPEVLPFAHSLASTFTLANRWFCSVPGPTYPNRRFLLSGTAFGGTATNKAELIDAFEHPPPNGTIFDHLKKHGISWANYFTDIPMTSVIPRITVEHFNHLHPRSRFFEDCAAGTLPAVSFVDPATGDLSGFTSSLDVLPKIVKDALGRLDPGETEETPHDMYYGERWAHETVEAVLRSPAWPRTLLIYTYDEHGGYYDHVPPPPAIAPDDIPPGLQPGDPAGDYARYGPRVPAIVCSPYSKPGGVSNDVHDHTSVLSTIEHKWNLPALTKRDANAATIMDFLDPTTPALMSPSLIAAPSEHGPSGPVSPSTSQAGDS